jgi:hypothetical protein
VPEQATYDAAEFASLPGWQSAALLPGVKAFIAGCARIAATSPLRKACDAARRVEPLDEASARRFIEAAFSANPEPAPEMAMDAPMGGPAPGPAPMPTDFEAQQPVKVEKTPGRNEPCYCGSGKKYKLCHGR